MKKVGTSSIWEKKYEPSCLEDYICSDGLRKLAQEIIDTKEVPTLLLCGLQGTGKTSLANVIGREIGAEILYINGSLENSVDTIRYKVRQFVMTSSSFMDDVKKLVIIDEADRMTAAQEALKVLIEESEKNARFIFCTNNPQKIIGPLHSRCRMIDFNKFNTPEVMKKLQVAYFQRLQFILTNEGIPFEKPVLAELVKKFFPDFRKLVNTMQLCKMMFDAVDVRCLSVTDDALIAGLMKEMKEKKFNTVRKICEDLDSDTFYTEVYHQIDTFLKDTCKPDVILVLADYSRTHLASMDKSLHIAACCTELMKACDWK